MHIIGNGKNLFLEHLNVEMPNFLNIYLYFYNYNKNIRNLVINIKTNIIN